MKYARYITAPDLTKVDTRYVSRLLDDLYRSHEERRARIQACPPEERRGEDRRKKNKVVFLDTRCKRSRRQQDGRRWQDSNKDNKHKRGIDYYA